MFIRSVVFTAIFALFVFCKPANAFKVDAHIWIAQEVLNDLKDGDLDIEIDGAKRSIRINDRYLSALRRHPKSFLLGSIGPDSFPDVFSGQLAIHPSVKGGWGTSDWLQHLVKHEGDAEDLAFALGYVTHAAGDVFAHTFVNKYAGDVFELQEHEWAAIRHIYIESFISNYLPPLKGLDGGIQQPHLSVQSDGRLDFPSALILDRFLLNSDSIGQLKRAGNMDHLTGVYDLHRSLTDFLSDDGQLLDLEALALKLVAEAVAGIPVADELAKEVQKLSNKVNTELNNAAGDVSKIAQDVNTELHKIEGLRNDIIEKGTVESISIAKDIAKLHLDIGEKAVELHKLIERFNSLPEKVATEVCENLPWPADELCGFVLKLNPARAATQILIDQAEKFIADARREIDQLTPKLKDAIREGFDLIEVELQTRVALTNQFIAFAGDKPFGNPFRRHFEIWKENLPVVLSEWTRANLNAIVNTIDPSHPSITEPLKKWLVCYGGGLFSVPVKATAGVCIVWNGVQQFEEELNEFEKKLADLTPITKEIFEAKERLTQKIEEIKEKVTSAAVSEILKEFDKRANTNTNYIFKGLSEKVEAGGLNGVMAKDESGQNLLLIPDAAERIMEEMHVAGGSFDRDSFNALYNAVVLSKLALLDRRGLVSLARSVGLRDTIFGPDLYGDDQMVSENILFGFVQNIDGNDQWHDLSPPHPRVGGYDGTDFQNRADNLDMRYGYYDRSCPRRLGMRMWADPQARQRLFTRLFKGKIAAGVDDPQHLGPGFAPVLDPGYPDLFHGNAWDDDGSTLIGNVAVTGFNLLLEDTATGTFTADIFADGKLISSAQYDQNGILHHAFTVEIGSSPSTLKIVKKNILGKALSIYSVELGCTGLAKESLVAETGLAEVLQGNSLWRLSKSLAGDGRKYIDLYESNKHQIDNPDLIYPGQIFRLPWPHPLQLSVL
ncbi:zinc dependent phospholipase C family protein [Rhizobium leguminosarum]